MITSNLALVLTGITTSIIGGFILYAGNNAIISGGSFTSKEDALILLGFKMLLIGLLTPIIYSIWSSITLGIGIISGLGIFILLGTYLMNEMVANWSHVTGKSLVMYLTGLIVTISGLGIV